ncbi:MAG: hypothetical protein ACK47B_22510 [Armatimonadota bacterium]
MPELGLLQVERAEVRVEFGEQALCVGYRPGAVTVALLDSLESGMRVEEAVAALLCDWDLSDGATPVPVQAEALRRVPLPILRRVLESVLEDALPKPPRAAASASSW